MKENAILFGGIFSFSIPLFKRNTPEKEFYVQRKNPVGNFKILTRDYN
ncbi:hypothetical protein CKL83_05100 [Bacillus anthracis]|uniref:Uncharacterized protein n=2 Tax=Bacillus anthracis TaxID=1392 RepID=A0A6H3AJA6_BACAN|nr:hypothetical protein BA_4015 [Bacillus anthracis str. Ames]AAT35403.1 hypothetical protein GBAA_4015 [Bacillus anthracis str. 'Ames Ancestor']ACP16448.1 hypothetical protein BAMEG_0617 [Bacillus anthracis str. CDC 684]AFH85212.1 Hypothetical Protein H9401_3826 [Bacillus anthracis str. H9401]AHK39983.1 hypothetical protein BAPAT_3849 [Bacillus anthracis str. SVA11]APT27333.1 hypothetical protein BVB96_20320 [Bacillus anthracis]EDR17525.1 hypothetical protein BAC_4014 [Bacillus anthracis str